METIKIIHIIGLILGIISMILIFTVPEEIYYDECKLGAGEVVNSLCAYHKLDMGSIQYHIFIIFMVSFVFVGLLGTNLIGRS